MISVVFEQGMHKQQHFHHGLTPSSEATTVLQDSQQQHHLNSNSSNAISTTTQVKQALIVVCLTQGQMTEDCLSMCQHLLARLTLLLYCDTLYLM